MPYSAATIANKFLSLADHDGKLLTNMQLQKLVYIAHGYYLAIIGKPLLYDEVKAWQWGPVIIDLYESLRKYGAGNVTERIPVQDVELDPMAERIIEKVWKAYGKFSGFRLSAITHKEGSPWDRTWRDWQYGAIPDELIAEYYRRLLNERRKPNQPT